MTRGFEELLANAGDLLSKLAEIRQRAGNTARQVAHAVGVAQTEFSRQFTQRTGARLPRKPRGHVSADGLGSEICHKSQH